MRVDLEGIRSGQPCWNAEAIVAYAAIQTEIEDRINSENPNIDVTPGEIVCDSCVTCTAVGEASDTSSSDTVDSLAEGGDQKQQDKPIFCRAVLTRSKFEIKIDDEEHPTWVEEVSEEAEIPGFKSKMPTDFVAERSGEAEAEVEQPPVIRGISIMGRRSLHDSARTRRRRSF